MPGSATNIPVLDKGFVRLIDHMGSDLTVVNAARVSFAKESNWESPVGGLNPCCPKLKDDDCGLIKYLAKHNHWTPFGHPQLTFHFKMPIFVARQFMRSNVGIVYNEISRRYVDNPPEFHHPSEWRGRPAKSLKQGSAGVVDATFGALVETANGEKGILETSFQGYCDYCVACYNNLLDQGVAPEQARIVLPLTMYTEFWATMSLAAASRVVGLRKDSHAQWEIQQYAHAIDTIVRPLFPVSWAALTGA